MDGINYFKTGWQHIISWDALDHLLFISALSAIYKLRFLKPVFILVTAFTIGHAATLFLSSMRLVQINTTLVERLIPVTIMVTALFNFFAKANDQRTFRLNYALALGFGLIHGLGYANAIRFELARDQSIVWPLLQFNLGLELGQLLVVAVLLVLGFLANKAGLSNRWWIWGLSTTAFLLALKMLVDRLAD